MNKSRSERKFPQLNNQEIKYCSVFYEGMHDDARTNLAIAQTAAIEGAVIVNYCEATSFLTDETTKKVTGAVVVDKETKEKITVKAKGVLICGGPFTDEIRQMEDSQAKEAVTGASGIHIILPSYYNPTGKLTDCLLLFSDVSFRFLFAGIGLVDMSTSDGRFLFFLPWNEHVLVGTTDHKCKANSRPIPDEAVSFFSVLCVSLFISFFRKSNGC
jgi:glycerol-3-phosphate dehydrogenase